MWNNVAEVLFYVPRSMWTSLRLKSNLPWGSLKEISKCSLALMWFYCFLSSRFFLFLLLETDFWASGDRLAVTTDSPTNVSQFQAAIIFQLQDQFFFGVFLRLWSFFMSVSTVNSVCWGPYDFGLILACGSSDGAISLLTFTGDQQWDVKKISNAHTVSLSLLSILCCAVAFCFEAVM